MEAIASLFGILLLVVVGLVFELVQHHREHRQEDALYEIKRRSEAIADYAQKNGGLKNGAKLRSQNTDG